MPKEVIDAILKQRDQFLRFVRRRIPDGDVAEDILQSAYMQAVRAGGKVREPNSAHAWFYRILRNAMIDWYRTRAAERGAMERLALEVAEGSGTSVQSGVECGCVEAAIAGLNERYASVLREVELGESSVSGYAASHGISSGAAAVRAHRARAALRRQLLRCCGDCAVRGCIECGCSV